MNTKVIVGGVVVVILIIGAMYLMSKHTAAPATNTTTQQANQQASAVGATSTPQVQGQDVAIGTGVTANVGDIVSVLYVGKLADGTVFDSSAAHNNQPLVFDLGTTTLIAGFQIGINGMKVGGERLLSIPPELAYGAQEIKDPATGKVVIPANSTLTFDVKLVGVQPAGGTSAQ